MIGPELRIITARAPASPIPTAEVARLSRDARGAISRAQIMKSWLLLLWSYGYGMVIFVLPLFYFYFFFRNYNFMLYSVGVMATTCIFTMMHNLALI